MIPRGGYYGTEQTPLFAGILGGTYKLVRFVGRGRPQIELYQIASDGLEMFRGYARAADWHRRTACRTCGAEPHRLCLTVGMIGVGKGNAMQGVHRPRKVAACISA